MTNSIIIDAHTISEIIVYVNIYIGYNDPVGIGHIQNWDIVM